MNTAQSEKNKVIELICGALPSKTSEYYDDFHDVYLSETDFKRIGMSIDGGLAIIKHEIVGRAPVFELSDVFEATPDDVAPESFYGKYCISMQVHSTIYGTLKSEQNAKVETLKFNDCTLTVNGCEIAFGEIDAKENGCYVLGHLFSHDFDEPSDYIDIHDKFFKNEEYNWKRYYDACGVINKRVSKKAGINSFLLYNGRKDGCTRINPSYIP